MSTLNDIYVKILEISRKYLSGHPPIHISSIAEELGLRREIVAKHAATLKGLRLIEFMDAQNETIALTGAAQFPALADLKLQENT